MLNLLLKLFCGRTKRNKPTKDIYLNIIAVNAIIVVTQETHISSVIAINPPITTFLDFYICNKNNVQMTCYSKTFHKVEITLPKYVEFKYHKIFLLNIVKFPVLFRMAKMVTSSHCVP